MTSPAAGVKARGEQEAVEFMGNPLEAAFLLGKSKSPVVQSDYWTRQAAQST